MMIATRQAVRLAKSPAARQQVRGYATPEAQGKKQQDQNLLQYALIGAGGLAAAYTAKVFFFSPEEAPISASSTKNKPMESNKDATSNATNSSKGDFLDGSGSNGSQSSYSSEYVNGSADHRGASAKESGTASAAQKHKESIEKTRSGKADGSNSGDRSGGAMRG